VKTTEHGDRGAPEVFQLIKEKGVVLCPTLAAGDAFSRYRGWRKGTGPEPSRIVQKKNSFREALQAGVTICAGGDVGVFSHGDNCLELELMVEYGMPALDVLRSVTSANARVFGIDGKVGSVKPGLLADLAAVEGDPSGNISRLSQVKMVMKEGVRLKQAFHVKKKKCNEAWGFLFQKVRYLLTGTVASKLFHPFNFRRSCSPFKYDAAYRNFPARNLF
jgi:imidazolonepropionase-like amidohydrolase